MKLNTEKCAKLFCALFIIISLFCCAFLPNLSSCSNAIERNKTSHFNNSSNESEINSSYSRTYSHQDSDNCTKEDLVKPEKPPFLEVITGFLSEKIDVNSNGDIENGNQSIVLNATTKQVIITCKASYPIDFVYEGHMSNRDASVISIKRIGNACFELQIELAANSENTGNYSCFSVGNPQIRSSIYIYFTPEFPLLLINREQKIIIKPQPNDKLVHLPCPTSNPNFVMKLEKMVQNPNSTVTQWMDYSNSSTVYGNYNPKFGWSLLISEFVGVSTVQFYRCSSDYNDKNEIHVYPIPISFNDYSAETVTHDSGEMSNLTTSNPFYDQFQPVNGISVKSPSARIKDCALKNGIIKSYDCNTWIECRMRQCKIHEMECDSKTSCSIRPENCPNAIIQCLQEGMQPVSIIQFQGFETQHTYNSQRDAPLTDVLHISVDKVRTILSKNKNQNKLRNQVEHPTLHLGDKKVTFSCTGSSFVFCIYFRWTILLTNGQFIDIPRENVTTNKWDKNKAFISSVVDIQIPSDFQGIQCTAPVWNEVTVKSTGLQKDEVLSRMATLQDYQDTSSKTNGTGIKRAILSDFTLWAFVFAFTLI